VPWNFGRSAFIKIWFERGLLMLPKIAMAVPMSEPAPTPRTCTSLTLSRSASPKWISNPPLGGILKALRRILPDLRTHLVGSCHGCAGVHDFFFVGFWASGSGVRAWSSARGSPSGPIGGGNTSACSADWGDTPTASGGATPGLPYH
jgi:hypothetical protein